MKEAVRAIERYQPLWGSWKIEELVGQGGGCEVYKAYKEEWGKRYTSTVKHMSFTIGRSDIKDAQTIGIAEAAMPEYFKSVVGSIINEIELMYKLRGNSNILTYEDHAIYQKKGDLGWDVLIRMEFLQPLPDFLIGRELGRSEVVKLGIDICKALEACDREGIIHRDIKDSSIFVSAKGEFKLGSFSLAKELDKGGRISPAQFSPLYMAPELYKEQSYDSSIDIYSLGIVMYKLLNRGRLPFMPLPPANITVDDTERSISSRMSGAEPALPIDAGEGLGAIILKACSYDRKDRYKSPHEFRQKLERFLKAESKSLKADSLQVNVISECAVGKDDYTETPIPAAEGEADARAAYAGELEKLAVVELITSIDKMNNAKRLAKKKLIRNIGIWASLMAMAFALAFISAYDVTPSEEEIAANTIKITPLPTVVPTSTPPPIGESDGEVKEPGYGVKEADDQNRTVEKGKNTQKLFKKAAAFYEQKDYSRAIAAFAELAKTDSTYKSHAQYSDSFFQLAGLHNKMGMQYFNEGKPELSVKEFEAALEVLVNMKNSLKEYDIDKYSKLQGIYRDNKSRMIEKMQKAEEYFTLAAECNKAGVRYFNLDSYYRARLEFEKAIKHLKDIRQLIPKYSSNGYDGLLQIYEGNLSRTEK